MPSKRIKPSRYTPKRSDFPQPVNKKHRIKLKEEEPTKKLNLCEDDRAKVEARSVGGGRRGRQTWRQEVQQQGGGGRAQGAGSWKRTGEQEARREQESKSTGSKKLEEGGGEREKGAGSWKRANDLKVKT